MVGFWGDFWVAIFAEEFSGEIWSFGATVGDIKSVLLFD